MLQGSVYFTLALLVAAVATNATAACAVSATIIRVIGDPNGAAIYRNNRQVPIAAGSRVCAGDRLFAGHRTTVMFVTSDRDAKQVSDGAINFPPREGQAPEADTDQ